MKWRIKKEMNLIACKGKLASLLEDLGYSKKRITEILKLLDKKDKSMTDSEAEKYYARSNY